jgi:SAM-dependent methyltransferase
VWSVSEAELSDVESWIEIVREVEPLFGPMPDFHDTLARNIARGTALCVRDDTVVLGGMLLRALPDAQIAWLAVRADARGGGVGRALVAEALRRYTDASEVAVDTFGEDNPQGRAARRLYEAFGFVASEHLERGPEGGTRQRFRRRRDPRRSIDATAASVAAYSGHTDEYSATHSPKMFETARRFANSLPSNSLILDAGCGPGRDLARFIALGHRARGVDLNPEFVAMANAHAPTSLGDLRDLASHFPATTFDGIWACASLVHLAAPDTVDVLGQFAQLLRPGGRLFACLRSSGDTGWLDESDGRRWYTVWQPDAFAAAIADAGFTVDQVDHDAFVEVWATRDP